MSNYYETLKISQSATSVEIQTAYETAYNYWRNLVNHHDPQMAQKANQALMAIEQIRTTLSDPVKRANYDASLSIGSIGGLADASAQPAATPMMTPPMARSSAVSASMAKSNIVNSTSWSCAKCYSVNAVGTRFCKKCGNQLGKTVLNAIHCLKPRPNFVQFAEQTFEILNVKRKLKLQKLKHCALPNNEG